MLGARGKLFWILLALTAATAIAADAVLEHELRASLESRIESELLRHARAVRETIELVPGPPDVETFDPLADRLGQAIGSRVTIILADGMVAGDSELVASDVRGLDNHAAHPEVASALAKGQGIARRHSATLNRELIYGAVRYERPDGVGVVRVALPTEQIERAIWRMRGFAILASLAGLGLAAVISGLTGHFASRTFRELVDGYRAAARGERRKSGVPSSGAIGQLEGSLNQMAEEFEQAAAALADERDRFETVLESMTEMVIVVDRDRRITMANHAALEVLRINGSPTGRRLFEAIRAPALEDLLKSGEDDVVAEEFDLPGATTRRVLPRVTRLRAGGGHLIVMHDVTEMRRLETIRRDFVANVSHELRTPVSVILGNSEILLDGAFDDRERAVQFLEAIHSNAERLSRLIADLLDLSRIEAGRHSLDLRRVPVDEALQAAVAAVRQRAVLRGHAIRVARTGLHAIADAEALEQILLNLMDNAVKYTPEGGHIAVGARRLDGEVRIEVEDDGPGIEPRHQSRIFERFYRVDPGRSKEMGGTGLGLAIVRHLVDAMGGKVGIELCSPHGSRFWFTLPASGPTSVQSGGR